MQKELEVIKEKDLEKLKKINEKPLGKTNYFYLTNIDK
jgi:hypothetical protein